MFSESLIDIECNHIFEIVQKVIVTVILKEIIRDTASERHNKHRKCTSPSKRVSAIFQMWFDFSLQPPKV